MGRRLFALGGMVWSAIACSFDPGDRWVEPNSEALRSGCEQGGKSCAGERLRSCELNRDGDLLWRVEQDCAATDEICSVRLQSCAACEPSELSCQGQVPVQCREDGSGFSTSEPCDLANGQVCRAGACVNLCREAERQRSNVGCEYWAADLDNAVAGRNVNAAVQQFAVVVSNPHADVAATVVLLQDDSAPGEPNQPVEIVTDDVPPLGLIVFPLGPREVDGSLPGQPETATHTAWSRTAYRIESNLPVVAYQFNPLDNVNVFSNDASLLKPVEALAGSSSEPELQYVALGWPQTIAITDDPATNFSASEPSALRAFLTLIGTREQTHVEITPTARVLGAGVVPETLPGERLEFTLDPYDVLNLETDDFNADFTGTEIASDAPLVVFTGSEASDAPGFDDLGERACCADHLEEQLDPVRTAGKEFVVPVAYNRSLAVANAGGDIGVVEVRDIFRVMATSSVGASVTTTLGGEHTAFTLARRGAFRDILSSRDFLLESDEPVTVAHISPSQVAAGVPRDLPGGDPSLLLIPPTEQYRESYVFLTPDFYAFDFLRIITPPSAEIVLDGRKLEQNPDCSADDQSGFRQILPEAARERYLVYRCQLSHPTIDPSADAPRLFSPGRQDDGVHRIESTEKIGVLVDGFDRNVSYSYAAGTELRQIVDGPAR